jgi:AbrB family looped-hinge helix DNA binding protein
MDFDARVGSGGRVTIPKPVRDALRLRPGDEVVFCVVDEHAVIVRRPDLLDLAGMVPVPEELRGVAWEEIRQRAWSAQARPRPVL